MKPPHSDNNQNRRFYRTQAIHNEATAYNIHCSQTNDNFNQVLIQLTQGIFIFLPHDYAGK
jgi:hypothetical protein